MRIRFLGAVKGVTGSSHLIHVNDKYILLDCGMYQGRDEDLNLEEFEINPAEINFLLLSHSHIDHSGRIPLLVKNGFKGKIYTSKPTYDLCQIMLADSAHIQESEAAWKNKKARRTGRKLVEPMYTQEDAAESLHYFEPILYDQIVNIDENITVKFRDAGHILGSSIIEMWIKEENGTTKLVYSGDLGMKEKELLRDPTIIEDADYVIMESTYGNRIHENFDKRTEGLYKIVLETVNRGGTVIIPSFAVGRTQEIIYELNKYYDSNDSETKSLYKDLKKIPVYIDSPLATKATEIFKRNAGVFDEETRSYIMKGDNPLEFENLHFTQSAEESKMLNFSDEPKIIISASGMCEAGRIKHHLKHNLWKKESSIVFVGYQAEGTLGRRILDGEKNVKIFGEEIHITAEIHNVEGFSGHADKIALLDWLKGFKEKPKKVFIVHGEQESKLAFAEEIRQKLNIDCIIPEYNKVYEVRKEYEVEETVATENIAALAKMAKEDQIAELLEEVEKLKSIFDKTLENTKGYLKKDSVNIDEYKEINNNIIDLEDEILNLSMLSSK